MNTDQIISALIGLAGACGNNKKTDNTDALVIKALAAAHSPHDDSEEESAATVDEIHAERDAVSPGCALCAFPCGNTSDYDMKRIYGADEKIKEIKLSVISELCRAACLVKNSDRPVDILPDDMELFYSALRSVSYDLKEEMLLSLLRDINEFTDKIKGEIPI